MKTDDAPFLTRHSEDHLCSIEEFPIPGESRSDWRDRAIKRWKFRAALADFLTEQGVVAILTLSSRDAGVIRVTGNPSYEPGKTPARRVSPSPPNTTTASCATSTGTKLSRSKSM